MFFYYKQSAEAKLWIMYLKYIKYILSLFI